METIWRPIGHWLPVLLLVSVLAGLLVAGATARFGSGWAVYFSYIVSLKERETALPGARQDATYRYDGYYALQTVELFSKTLAEWIVAPETVAHAHQAADLPEPTGLLKAIAAEAAAPQLVRVTVRAANKAQAEQLAAGLQAVIRPSIPTNFTFITTEPWVTSAGLNKNFVGIATGILIFFVGLNLLVLRESLRYGHRD